jgi:hypothetical protein
MPKIAINVQGVNIVLTQADERTKVTSALSAGDAYQLGSMLFASMADAAANYAFHQAAGVACSDCQVKIARARQALAEQAAKARLPKVPVTPIATVEGMHPIEEK